MSTITNKAINVTLMAGSHFIGRSGINAPIPDYTAGGKAVIDLSFMVHFLKFSRSTAVFLDAASDALICRVREECQKPDSELAKFANRIYPMSPDSINTLHLNGFDTYEIEKHPNILGTDAYTRTRIDILIVSTNEGNSTSKYHKCCNGRIMFGSNANYDDIEQRINVSPFQPVYAQFNHPTGSVREVINLDLSTCDPNGLYVEHAVEMKYDTGIDTQNKCGMNYIFKVNNDSLTYGALMTYFHRLCFQGGANGIVHKHDQWQPLYNLASRSNRYRFIAWMLMQYAQAAQSDVPGTMVLDEQCPFEETSDWRDYNVHVKGPIALGARFPTFNFNIRASSVPELPNNSLKTSLFLNGVRQKITPFNVSTVNDDTNETVFMSYVLPLMIKLYRDHIGSLNPIRLSTLPLNDFGYCLAPEYYMHNLI